MVPNSPIKPRTPEEALLETQIRMENIINAVTQLDEVLEGTLRTRGLKDRLLLAENDIKLNKEAWEKVDKAIADLRNDIVANRATLGKWQPYMNVIAWLVAGAGSILLAQILTGHWQIVVR